MLALRVLLATAVGLLVTTTAAARPFPATIALPTGFQPEGVAVGKGHTFYVGSIPTGAIYRGDLRTGEGSILVPGEMGVRNAIGLDVDERNRLFVAGGPGGRAFVYDARTGASLASVQLAPGSPTFVNDVVVTGDAAWFTDSFRPVLYRLAIAPNGTLGGVTTVPLSGDIVFVPGDFNVNGIDATPNGKMLVVVQSNTGQLFTVDPATGVTDRIGLSGGEGHVMGGDGILLDGNTLYVVRNTENKLAVIELSPDLESGTIVAELTSAAFDVPTTIAEFGNRLYLVNARFGTPNPGTAAYSVVQLPKMR